MPDFGPDLRACAARAVVCSRRTPTRCVERDMIVSIEPFEERSRALVAIAAAHTRRDLRNAAPAVDGIEDMLLVGVDRQDEVGVRVAPIQKDAGGAGWKALADTGRPRQTKRD